MNIQLGRPGVILLISIVFLLMTGSLTALAYIFSHRDSQDSNLNQEDILDLLTRIRLVTLALALVFLVLAILIYRFAN